MKGARELTEPANRAEVARVARAVAETVEKICEVNGWDQQVAGLLAMRASIDILLRDMQPDELGEWLIKQAAELRALAPTGGNA